MKLKLDIPNVDYIEIDNVDELMEILDKLNEKREINIWNPWLPNYPYPWSEPCPISPSSPFWTTISSNNI